MTTSEIETLKAYFASISFTQPLAKNLTESTVKSLNEEVRGDDLKTQISIQIPCEAFLLQEVMIVETFYERYRSFLNLFDISTPSSRFLRDMLVLLILIAIYGDDKADQMFTVYRENRKDMRQTGINDPSLYSSEEHEHDTENREGRGDSETHEFNSETFKNLPADKLRDIIAIMLSGSNNGGGAGSSAKGGTGLASKLLH